MAGALHTVWSALRGDVRLRVDDETVSMLRHEDVYGRHEDERVDDQCDQLLFSSYRLTASPQTHDVPHNRIVRMKRHVKL